jgi:RecA-family ATPase
MSAERLANPNTLVNDPLSALPQQMRDARRWLVHFNKQPFYPDGSPRRGALDSPDDVARFGTYDEAMQALRTGRFSGLGFALGADEAGNYWQGIDLDMLHLHPELAGLLGESGSYVETSPSGMGFHIIGYGRQIPTLGSNGSGAEAYSGGRYLTVTGQGAPNQSLVCIADFVERSVLPLHGRKSPALPASTQPEIVTPETVQDLRSALSFINSDDRAKWVSVGLALKSLGDVGRELFFEWSATSPKHEPIADGATWESFKPERTGYAAIFAEAQRNCWINPRRAMPIDTTLAGFGGALPVGARPITGAFPSPQIISALEWHSARSTPDCIVENLLFADVAVFIAPGGMGKTTLKLFEAIHIVLGLSLYGLTVHKSGAVVIITSEDSRAMLVARLRSIATSMILSPEQIAIVMQRILIVDVSGNGFKLTEVRGDVVRPSAGVDEIIETCRNINPVLIVIDPAVSFGVGESRVNDAEQGLIEAARKLRSALNCCVQFIHHSGKQNARDKAVDQYAGRGGSAFADGARMVHVLQSLTPDEWRTETGTELLIGETGLRLARPKMSYCAPVGDILIRRAGYGFTHVVRVTSSKHAQLDTAANRLWELLVEELAAGRYHSRNSIQSLDTGLKRADLRASIDWLIASNRIESRDVPNAGKNGRRDYLHPIGEATANRPPISPFSDKSIAEQNINLSLRRSIGKITGGEATAVDICPHPCASPNYLGEPSANRGEPFTT